MALNLNGNKYWDTLTLRAKRYHISSQLNLTTGTSRKYSKNGDSAWITQPSTAGFLNMHLNQS
ncbi:hypothetical protein [Candidatus Enterovibrio escicola]|uniref:hypothetical protein n=1 Tax=Candidatus Enterovibrio escicola TaxID=1927127 RepID=UPI0011BAD6D0|nr:hypothetical protein [Candidatus Enterovibrio escacola]